MNTKSAALISFIIPAYNAGKTLKECIYSIINDNNSQIEVIIVENGSSDATTEIADYLCKIDSRVKLFHSEQGVSNARNKGIREATGKWIVFIDADDLIIKGKMNGMIEDAEKSDADLILYGYRVGNNYRELNSGNFEKVYTETKIEDIRVKMLKNPTCYMQVWAKLFRSEVIKSKRLEFDNRLRLSEDSDFTLRYSKYCKKIVLSTESIYQYTLNPLSTMRQIDGDKADDYEFAMNITAQSIVKESSNIRSAFQQYILMHLNVLMVREVYNIQNSNSYLKKYDRMQNLLERPVFKEAINSVHITKCRSLRLLPILVLKLKMFHCASVIFILRARQNYRKEKMDNQ